jgi:hypothetical protein
VGILANRLPPTWKVGLQAATGDPELADLVISATGAGAQAVVFVEVKSDVSPRDIDALIGGPWRRWRRQTGNQPLLLVAPYLGPRVRALLGDENVSYIDLTGNMRITLDYPGLFIEASGAQQDPRATRAPSTVRGAKAGAVVRALVDASPPYSGAEIARAAEVNEGYVSRILATLLDDGLISRDRSGVSQVDWAALLERRARGLDLFRSGAAFSYYARQGSAAVLERLRLRPTSDDWPPTVSGSFAAARLAPIAAPRLLVVYTTNPRVLATDLELLPAETGADTVFIRPENDTEFVGATRDRGIAWAATSQVALDCLTGNGRMPSEGEALITWMKRNEAAWRYPSIQALFDARVKGKSEA